jgi:hypothetical protein
MLVFAQVCGYRCLLGIQSYQALAKLQSMALAIGIVKDANLAALNATPNVVMLPLLSVYAVPREREKLWNPL